MWPPHEVQATPGPHVFTLGPSTTGVPSVEPQSWPLRVTISGFSGTDLPPVGPQLSQL